MKKQIKVIKDSMSKISFKKFTNFKTPVLTLVIGLLLGYLVTSSGYIPNPTDINVAKVKTRTEAYLKTLPLDSYEVKSVVKDGDVFKIELTVNSYPYTSYMTRDGRLLFQGGIDLAKELLGNKDGKAQTNNTTNPAAKELTKSDKPSIELFVMSYCPYGTQIEKGLLSVLTTLKDKIDFQLKFVSYAMHGEKEVVENMNQYCIQKNYGRDKLTSYLQCFLKDGDSKSCVQSSGFDSNALAACTTQVDKEFKVMELFNDKSKWEGSSYPPFNTNKEDNTKYSVQGSPTMIINGTEAQSGRDSASLLKTVCSAFNNQPEECNSKLDSNSPTPGFGFDKTVTDASASNAAQCGN